MAKDITQTPFDFPFTGKLITSADPTLIASNYRSLVNMRYSDYGVSPIGGHTKVTTSIINDGATHYPNVTSGIHYKKVEAPESHILVQAWTAGFTAPKVFLFSTAIPSQGNFSTTALLTASSGASYGRFSYAPNDAIVYCNGKDTKIWSGLEERVSAFYNYELYDAFFNDYSDVLSNPSSATDNVATIYSSSGGNDTYTKLLLHFDGSFADSSASGHTLTTFGGLALSATAKFGSNSGNFGAGAYATIPDSTDFDFSAGTWTIDFWIQHTGGGTAYRHATGAGDYFDITITSTDVRLWIISSAGASLQMETTGDVVPSDGNFHHVEVVEDGDHYYLFVNGIMAAYSNSTVRPANYTGTVQLGDTAAAIGLVDEFRVSKGIARHKNDFRVPTAAYPTAETANGAHFYIGTTRPTKGFKLYISTPNANTSTMTVQYWNGTAWTAVGGLSDGTASGGVSCAQTGTVTFNNTEATAKVHVIDGVSLFWLKVKVSSMSTGTKFYYVTTDMAFQNITDIWSGAYQPLTGVFRFNEGYTDYTVAVAAEDYDSTLTSTYADLSSFDKTMYVLIQSPVPLMGVYMKFADGKRNTTPNRSVLVDYWGGTAYGPPPSVVDETRGAMVDGHVLWSSNLTEETVRARGELAVYTYRLRYSGTLSTNVYLDYLVGIPTPKVLNKYAFSFIGQNRLWLANREGSPNEVQVSSRDTNCVFNGDDSTIFTLGRTEELVAGGSMFAQFGSSLYELIVLCKPSETWVIQGTSPEDYVLMQVSPSIGCVAPETFRIINLGPEITQSVNRQVAVFQSSFGVYMFDGRSFLPLHEDIKDIFDPIAPTINTGKVDKSVAWYDDFKSEYHWCFPATGASLPNREFVYDMRRQRWYQTTRPYPLQYGLQVEDTAENRYSFGFDSLGYMQHLEKTNAYTFDGTAISFEIHTGDIALAKSGMYESKVRQMKLITRAKTSTTTPVTVTHYGDGSTTATATLSLSPNKTGYRIAMPAQSCAIGDYVFHSFKFTTSTSNEAKGFEPLSLSGTMEVIRVKGGC